MTVKRIVPNLLNAEPRKAEAFYRQIFDLEMVMDHEWVVTFANDQRAAPQISLAAQGGSGTPVPAVSIEVDNVDAVYEKALKYGAEIVYDICNEEWGVRRFYVRDPGGLILNVLAHL